jgi:hypothetical protein
VVQMHVQRRKHVVIVLVLHFGETFGKLANVMVVDQRHRAHHDAVGPCGLLLNQGVANQIAKGFRPVGVAAPRNQVVKLFK